MAKKEKSYNDLRKQAKKLGLAVPFGIKKSDLEEMIKKAKEAPEGAESKAAGGPCPDCTVLIADGGKSEFSGKGGPKPGLINPDTLCPTCEGSGTIGKEAAVEEDEKPEAPAEEAPAAEPEAPAEPEE